MKPISRFIVFVLTICLLNVMFTVTTTVAQPVDINKAKSVAKNFFADRVSRSKVSVAKGISSQNLEMVLVHEEKGDINNPGEKGKGYQNLPVYYIFNVKDETDPKADNGFIIVSADQRVPAVLGYSFTGELLPDDQPSSFKAWMNHYKEQIISAIELDIKAEPEITDEWQKYSGTTELKGTEQLSEVLPLLETQWNQSGYCNNLCPIDASIPVEIALNGHVPAGCVAVAMAQIMNYYKFPGTNNPIPGYTSTNYGEIPGIGATAYDWENMRGNIDKFNPEQPTSAQIDAVSTLIYHCGVAVQMKYGPSGSGAGSPLAAFVDYFKYSPDMQDIDKSSYSDEEWINALKNELDNNRAVYYAGYENDNWDNGHSFVCDGYQDDNHFHFNWGLGSGPDGYYFLNDLTPGSHNYNFKQWAIIGISPDQSLTVSDADGNIYNVVTIGSQTWMAENLKTTKYNDGITNIEYPGDNNSEWQTNNSGAYAWWGNNIANKNNYGALYNWYAVNSGNLCPVGWHVPTFYEWLDLFTFLGEGDQDYGRTIGGGLLKETGVTHWADPNTGASDIFGFTALPGGNRNTVGDYFHLNDGTYGLWWASGYWWSDDTETYGTSFMLSSTSAGVYYGKSDKNVGYSVRCLKGPLVETVHVDAGAYSNGKLGTSIEEDWYKFLTVTTGTYVIQTSGITDTYMCLYDNDQMTKIAEDNDGAGIEHNSKIVHSLNADTWYFVKITGYNGSTGNYSISVNLLPEPPTASDQAVCSDGTNNQTLTATASAPSGSIVVWYDTASDGNIINDPTQVGVGSITYYAASYNTANQCYSQTRTPVTLTINELPTGVISGTALICEGSSADLSFELTGEPPWSITYTDGTTAVTIPDIGNSPYSISVNPVVNTVYTLIAVSDINCTGTPSGSASVTINSAPVINNLTTVPYDPVALIDQAAIVEITASFEDADNNVESATFDFGDGSNPETIELNGTDITAQIYHIYHLTGVFVVTVTLSDDCSSSVSMSYNYVVIYDPTGGFVTGGGWIDSPPGAYVPDPTLAGEATFGFESKYKKGATVPSGNTEFQFHVAGMNFKSTSYQWLVIAGSNAKFKGYGTINGTGSYGFILTAADGSPDRFRIKIWDLETGSIVYDNEAGSADTSDPTTAISGGSIVVHSTKDNKNMSTPEFGITAYPNPFTERIYFEIQLMTDSKVSLEIFDTNGSKITNVYSGFVVGYEEYIFVYIPEKIRSGILIYRFVVNGKQTFTGELIHY